MTYDTKFNAETMNALFDLAMGSPDPELDEAQRRRRDRILDASGQLFLDQGYRKTSLDDIARKAAVAKGTIYSYFPNKSALLINAIAGEKRKYVESFLPLFDENVPAKERLRGFVRISLTLPLQSPLLHKLMVGGHELELIINDLDPALFEKGLEFDVGLLAHLLDEALDGHSFSPEGLRDRAKALLNLVFGAASGLHDPIHSGLDTNTFVDLVVDLIQRGLSPAWGTDASPA